MCITTKYQSITSMYNVLKDYAGRPGISRRNIGSARPSIANVSRDCYANEMLSGTQTSIFTSGKKKVILQT